MIKETSRCVYANSYRNLFVSFRFWFGVRKIRRWEVENNLEYVMIPKEKKQKEGGFLYGQQTMSVAFESLGCPVLWFSDCVKVRDSSMLERSRRPFCKRLHKCLKQSTPKGTNSNHNT